MAQTDIPTRVREIFTEQKGDHRQGEELLKLWRENSRETYKEAQKSGSSFLLLALTFSLLATTSLDESTVFGLKFRSVQVPLTLLYIAAGYLFYRAISLYSFAQLIEGCIREAMESYSASGPARA
jgi:hypothetical protein